MVAQDARQDDGCARGTQTQSPKPPRSVLAAASLPSARPEVAPPRRTRAQTVRCVEAARGVRDWVVRLERACLRRQPLCSSNSRDLHSGEENSNRVLRVMPARHALADATQEQRTWQGTRVTLSGLTIASGRGTAQKRVAGGRWRRLVEPGTWALTARQTRPPGRPPRWSRSGCRPPPSS